MPGLDILWAGVTAGRGRGGVEGEVARGKLVWQEKLKQSGVTSAYSAGSAGD